ncbi:MAG TPA: glycoside hydrolase family 18 protein [Victivallales bacterium]|nr:glycoside hydrolase family 18 protein [Victivallales bacterium]
MKRLLFILLFFLTFTATVFKVSAQDAKVIIPQPLVGQFYPIYNDWLVPTNEVPFKDINFIFIAFAHVYSNNEKPASIILSYENARKEKTKLTAGDFDSDRIRKLISVAKKANPNMKFLISMGWNTDGKDWKLIIDDYDSGVNSFPQSVLEFLVNNNLDGFDIDYESIPKQVTSEKLTEILKEVYELLHQPGKKQYILSITPAETGSLTETNLALFDIVNPQTYASWVKIDQYTKLNVPTDKISYGICTDPNYNPNVKDAIAKYKNDQLRGIFNWSMQSDQQNYDFKITEEMSAILKK